jgi:hypothetical protein
MMHTSLMDYVSYFSVPGSKVARGVKAAFREQAKVSVDAAIRLRFSL